MYRINTHASFLGEDFACLFFVVGGFAFLGGRHVNNFFFPYFIFVGTHLYLTVFIHINW